MQEFGNEFDLSIKLWTIDDFGGWEKAYQKCFDAVLEQGVEVPVCEYREFILYSAERMNRSTIPESTTVFYSWFNEIQKITMR